MPPNADLRLSIANIELRKEVHGQHLLSKYAQHTSHVVVIWRNKGGGDDYPQLQMLYDEGWFRCDYHHGYYLFNISSHCYFNIIDMLTEIQ